jgi:hypothetical protein
MSLLHNSLRTIQADQGTFHVLVRCAHLKAGIVIVLLKDGGGQPVEGPYDLLYLHLWPFGEGRKVR